MSRYLYLAVFVVALVLVAVAGWTVDGIRRLRAGGQRPRVVAPGY